MLILCTFGLAAVALFGLVTGWSGPGVPVYRTSRRHRRWQRRVRRHGFDARRLDPGSHRRRRPGWRRAPDPGRDAASG